MTVGEYIRPAEVARLSWPLPEAMDDAVLERQLFPPQVPTGTVRPLPQWSEVHRELRRKGVTLSLLRQEYKAAHPDGLQYGWFCEQYRAWAGKLDVVMRQEHRAGERLFVDYAGQTAEVIDHQTGEVRQAQVFVAVLGASNYTFAEAAWTRSRPDWTASHVRALKFLGGVRELVVYDDLSGNIIGQRHPGQCVPGFEGADMAAQETVHSCVEEKPQVNLPAPTEHHDKSHQRSLGPANAYGAKITPAHLSLLTGQGAKAKVDLGGLAGTQLRDSGTNLDWDHRETLGPGTWHRAVPRQVWGTAPGSRR